MVDLSGAASRFECGKIRFARSTEQDAGTSPRRWEDTYGKRGSETTLSGRFANIIRHANQQTGRQVVNTKDYIYVFEFKLDGSAFDALEQIEHTGYLIPYTAEGRQLVKVGVSFDAGERNIGEWEIENGK